MRLTGKSWALLAIAALLAMGLGVQAATAPTPPAALPALAAVDAKDVRRVTIATLVDKLELDRSGEGWALVEPLQAPADRSLVDALVGPLVAGTRMDEELDAGNLEDYGVDDQHALNVEVWTDAPVAAVGVRVGKTAGPGAVFVRLPNDDKVYRASLGTREAFERAAADWRDRTALALDPKALVGVRIDRAAAPILLTRPDPSSPWTLQGAASVDQATVAQLTQTLARVKASQLHNPDYDGGFATPVATVTLTSVGGETHRLLIGNRVDQNAGFVRVDDRADVFRVSAAYPRIGELPLDVLRDRTLLAFDPTQVARVEMVEAGLTLALAPSADGTGWTITQPANMDADQELVAKAVATLSTLRATRLATDTTFVAAPTTLTVTLKDGTTQSLRFGQVVKDEQGHELVRVRATGHAEVYELAVAALADLRRAFGRS